MIAVQLVFNCTWRNAIILPEKVEKSVASFKYLTFGKFSGWNVSTILFANGQENGHAKGPYGKAHNFGNTYNFSRTCYDHFGWSWHRNWVLLVGLNSNQRQAIHQFSKYAKLLCDNQIITQAVRNCLSKTHSGAVTIKIENNPLVHLLMSGLNNLYCI